MKILHLTNHLNTGGITTYIRTLGGEQARAGHDVFVWGTRGTCSEDLRAMGITVLDDVPFCKSELSPRLWFALPELIQILKTRSIDIVHTHTRVAQVLTAGATFFVKIPYVSTAHMFYKPRLGRRLFPCWGKTVIAISRTIREGLMEIFGGKNLPPVVIVNNGMDIAALRAKIDRTDREAVRKAYGYSPDHLVVVSLARLIPVKGAHLLVEAFAIARKQVPRMRLLLGGAGEDVYVQNLKRRVVELGLEPDVLFLGNVAGVEKPLKAADIFVAPYIWEEGFGIAVLEARVAGQVIVGARSGSIPELLEDGRCGLLFEKGDAEALAQFLIKLSEDTALRAKLGGAASRGVEEYSSTRMCERIQKVYENVLKEKV